MSKDCHSWSSVLYCTVYFVDNTLLDINRASMCTTARAGCLYHQILHLNLQVLFSIFLKPTIVLKLNLDEVWYKYFQ